MHIASGIVPLARYMCNCDLIVERLASVFSTG